MKGNSEFNFRTFNQLMSHQTFKVIHQTNPTTPDVRPKHLEIPKAIAITLIRKPSTILSLQGLMTVGYNSSIYYSFSFPSSLCILISSQKKILTIKLTRVLSPRIPKTKHYPLHDSVNVQKIHCYGSNATHVVIGMQLDMKKAIFKENWL